jgi:hypothetical protein
MANLATIGLDYDDEVVAKVIATNSVGSSSASTASSSGALLNTVPTQMAAPTLQGTATHDSVTVLFSSLTTAADIGGLSITKYVVEYKKTADASYTSVDPATSPTTVSSLTPNTAYLFKVTAVNSIGSGTPSSTLSVTTDTYSPNTPTSVTTTESGAGLNVDITWTAGSNNG